MGPCGAPAPHRRAAPHCAARLRAAVFSDAIQAWVPGQMRRMYCRSTPFPSGPEGHIGAPQCLAGHARSPANCAGSVSAAVGSNEPPPPLPLPAYQLGYTRMMLRPFMFMAF